MPALKPQSAPKPRQAKKKAPSKGSRKKPAQAPAPKPGLLTPSESQKVWAAIGLIILATLGLSFLTGALCAHTVQEGWRLSAYDARGTRRFALTLSLSERPDIAFFEASGQRWDHSLKLPRDGSRTP